jgi:hypothetical protein
MLPAAPGRFSTITDWPHIELSGVAISRGSASDAPPGLKGTMILTSLLGKVVCALADNGAAVNPIVASVMNINLHKRTDIESSS